MCNVTVNIVPDQQKRCAIAPSRTCSGVFGFIIGLALGFATTTLIEGWPRAVKPEITSPSPPSPASTPSPNPLPRPKGELPPRVPPRLPVGDQDGSQPKHDLSSSCSTTLATQGSASAGVQCPFGLLFPSPTLPMRYFIEWILLKIENTLDWLEWRLKLSCRFRYFPPREGEVLAQYGCSELHAEVLDIELRGERFAVQVTRVDRNGNCVSDDRLTYRQAVVLMEALQEATLFISERWGPRRLPIVPLWGKRYFLDERLNEMRNVENACDRLEFIAV